MHNHGGITLIVAPVADAPIVVHPFGVAP